MAGVTWPAAIYVLVSDDGRNFRNVGDLVALDHKIHGAWPEGYAIRRLATSELHTKARYVSFVVLPIARGLFIFVDEVEVFLWAGPAAGQGSRWRARRQRGPVRSRSRGQPEFPAVVQHRPESDRTAFAGKSSLPS